MWEEEKKNLQRNPQLKKIKVFLSTQNNTANKQTHGDVSLPGAKSCLNMKDFSLSLSSQSPGRGECWEV